MQAFEKELVAKPRVACDYFLRWSHYYYYYYYYFERERDFQLMASTYDNSSLLLDQDTNQFLK